MRFKRLITWLLLVSLLITGLTLLTGCEEEDHLCLKCNGSGKVRDEYGYYAYVPCPRCNGAGYLTY